MSIITYRNLEVWKRGMDLVEECYKLTAMFPKSELYGLTSQVRRAVISISSNVAEGRTRRSTKAFRNHVSIALGSHGELETCIELANRLGFLSRDHRARLMKLCDPVGRMLSGLHRALARKVSRQRGNPSPRP